MVALVNETLSYNQWLQRYFSQPTRSESRSLLFITIPKFSRAFRLRWLVQWLVGLSRGFCFGGKRTEAVMHKFMETKETTVQCIERGWPLKIYQPVHEWNNCFKILFLSITADSTPTLWTVHVTFCGWPDCSKRHQIQRLQLPAVSQRVCEANHWWDSRLKTSTAVGYLTLYNLNFAFNSLERIIFQNILVKMNRIAIRWMKYSF